MCLDVAGRPAVAPGTLLANTGDAIVFMATINRIADILKHHDTTTGRATDTIEVRRSRAIGILAQPARALALLLAHHHDPDHADPEPESNEPEPDESVEHGSFAGHPEHPAL